MSICHRLTMYCISAGLIAATLLPYASRCAAAESAARTWNEQLLSAIRSDTARPTIHARNLYHLSAAMYDAWAAYDDVAQQVFHTEKVGAASIDVAAARLEAISFAAYRIIQHRFVTGPAGVGPGRDLTDINTTLKMLDLNYDPSFVSTFGDSPAALGNRVAQTVINAGLADGANEANNYAKPPGWDPINPNLNFSQPGTVMNDPNRWQALHFANGGFDQFGNPFPPGSQKFLSPYWGAVMPFGLQPSDRGTGTDPAYPGVPSPYFDQGPPPQLGGAGDAEFKANALEVIRFSSYLDPNEGAMIDVSPSVRGNRVLGTYDDVGHPVNPYTGQPYEANVVNRADWGRLTAEFWADGPKSSAPPGHWNELRNEVSDKLDALAIPKTIGSSGSVVDDLEWDVKSMLALNGAVHDAAITAWNHKGYYDYSRPISQIRHMAGLGQSSEPALANYHPQGIPLEPNLVEVITTETTMPGERHEHLAGHEGEIAIRAWQGEGAIPGELPFDDPSEIAGVDWMLAENWMPYQLISFVTPPFAGYISGHSTFSRAAAEVLTAITGDEFFPGGMGEYHFVAGEGIDFEYGPTTDVTLQWATYFDAADEAGLSRLYGGIHPAADDLPGRRLGSLVGQRAWGQAMRYFAGVPEPGSCVLCTTAMALILVRVRHVRW
jgi:hypothetical protein